MTFSILKKIIYDLLNFRFSRIIIRYLIRFIKPKGYFSVKIGKHKMYAKTFDRFIALLILKFSSSEDMELNIMKKTIRKGMNVIDIGSNMGYYTLQLADLVGPKGKVFAFEPDPENYSLLVKNIGSNNYRNIIAIRKAVSNKNGKIRLFLSEENKGDHRIFNSGENRKSIEIETVKLDTFIPKKDVIDIIKMDIQGSEYLAFLGMVELIKRNKRVIIITEFSPYLIKKFGITIKQLIDKIIGLGFKLNLINENKRCIESVSYNDLLKICDDNKPFDFVNLYLNQ